MATARNTLAVAIKLDGTAQAKKDLEDVGKAGEKAFANIARAANKVAPGLGTQLQEGLRGLRTQFLAAQAVGARFAQSTATLATALNTVGIAAAQSAKKIALITGSVQLAAGALLLFAQRSAANAERIVGQAEALGISAQAYQNFETAAKNAGLSQETFDQILSRFVTNAADAGDASGDAAKKTTDLAKSLRQIEVTAEDGSKKLITVRGTSEAMAKSVKTVGGAAKGTEQDLINFAKKIEALKTPQERLNAVLEAGFAKRVAPQVVRAMLAIARDADPAARAINKVLEPLDNASLGALVNVDSSFDRLGTNLSRIKDQIVAIFGPALSNLLNGVADAIFNNQKAISDFIKEVSGKAIILVRDLFALLRGDDAAVQNKGLISFRDTIIQVGTITKGVFTNVIVPAFQLVVKAADQVAAALNAVFGTKFSGLGLVATAVIFQIIGGFRLLLALFATGLGAIQFVKDLGKFLLLIRPILTGLVGLVARFSAFLVGLAVSNPLLAAIILLAAGFAFLVTRENAAEKAARLHQEAMQQLNQSFLEAKAGVTGAADAWRNEARASLQAAQAALTNAEAQAKAASALVNTFPKSGTVDRITGTNRGSALLNEQRALEQLDARKRELIELNNQIIQQNQSLQQGSDATAVATADFSAEVAKASTATDTLQTNVRKVDPAFTEAAIAARKLGQELQSQAANPQQIAQPFQEASQQVTQAFSNIQSTVSSASASISATWSSTVAGMESRIQSLVGIVQSVAAQIEAALARIQSRIASVRSSAGSGSSSGLGTSRFAGGGTIRGPGTATSDSIPVWASTGEFMVRTRAAMKVGYGFLNAINSGRYDLAGIFDLLRARGYALGGAIGGLAPALAGGLSVDIPRLSFGPLDERSSPIAPLQPVTFVLDGQRVDGFSAAPGAVDELMRASAQKRVRSNGRKPGWYGGSV